MTASCAGQDQTRESDDVAAIPGPSLDGPNVAHFPVGPYQFTNPRKYVTRGERRANGSCAYVAEGTMSPEDGHMQEIVVAEDPDTCRYLVVGGEPAS